MPGPCFTRSLLRAATVSFGAVEAHRRERRFLVQVEPPTETAHRVAGQRRPSGPVSIANISRVLEDMTFWPLSSHGPLTGRGGNCLLAARLLSEKALCDLPTSILGDTS